MTEVDLIEAERSRILASLRKLGRPLKGTRRRTTYDPASASAKALRESGIAEKDIQVLIEGHQHEVASARSWAAPATFSRRDLPPRVAEALQTFQEDCGGDCQDGTGQLLMPDASGWKSEGDTNAVYSHAKHGTVRLHAGGRFTHHAPGGRIAGSGTGQAALDTYLRGLKAVDVGGSPAAAEAVDTVLGRVFGGERGPAAALSMAEARLQPTEEHGSTAAHRLVVERLARRERVPVEATKLLEAVRARTTQTGGGGDLHDRLRKAATR